MDIMIRTTIDELIPNPDVVKVLKENGYCILGDKVVDRMIKSELELAKLKVKIKKGELIESNNTK